jgi:hypothetical protein
MLAKQNAELNLLQDNRFIKNVIKEIESIQSIQSFYEETNVYSNTQYKLGLNEPVYGTLLNYIKSQPVNTEGNTMTPLELYLNIIAYNEGQNLQATETKIIQYLIAEIHDSQKNLHNIVELINSYNSKLHLTKYSVVNTMLHNQHIPGQYFDTNRALLSTIDKQHIYWLLKDLNIFPQEALNAAALNYGLEIEHVPQPAPVVYQQVIQEAPKLEIDQQNLVQAFISSNKDLEGFISKFQFSNEKNAQQISQTLKEIFKFFNSIKVTTGELTIKLVNDAQPGFLDKLINVIKKLFGCKPVESCARYQTWQSFKVDSQQQLSKATKVKAVN